MKKKLLTLTAALVIAVTPIPSSYAAITVVDFGAIAQLIEQIKKAKEMIDQLQSLTHYADLDHIGIGHIHFGQFFSQYKSLFNKIMNEIDGYQNGGLLGQINRLEEVYASYYNDWGDKDAFTLELDPLRNQLKKQILWTRIQFKHAAKVAAKVRSSIPDSQAQIQGLLSDSQGTVGLLGAVKVGNQLTGMLGTTLQNLNVQLAEQIQAQVGEGLERNQKEGLKINRAREAIFGWGTDTHSDTPAPLNPFENF